MGLSRTVSQPSHTTTASFYEHRNWRKEECKQVEEDIALLG